MTVRHDIQDTSLNCVLSIRATLWLRVTEKLVRRTVYSKSSQLRALFRYSFLPHSLSGYEYVVVWPAIHVALPIYAIKIRPCWVRCVGCDRVQSEESFRTFLRAHGGFHLIDCDGIRSTDWISHSHYLAPHHRRRWPSPFVAAVSFIDVTSRHYDRPSLQANSTANVGTIRTKI